MGCVYEGEHVGLGRGVAIKIMHANYSANRDVVERFRREAQSASALENQHVVDVLDVDTDMRFGLYMVMELLRGEDLSGTLKRQGSFRPRVACAIVAQAAAALACAHSAGIVHRDLKPANLFLVKKADGSGLLKLLDFSVAKISNVTDNARSQITRAGSALGTPQYMAPEQAQGTEIDHRVDIYALGAVLFELLTGQAARVPKPTYELMIVDVITQPARRPRDLLPDVPEELDNLPARMMNQDAERRPDDMDEVLGALLQLYPDLATTRLMMPDPGDQSEITLTSAGAGADLFSTAKRSQDNLRAVSLLPRSSFGPASEATPHVQREPVQLPRRHRLGAVIALGLIALLAGAILTWLVASPSEVENPAEPGANPAEELLDNPAPLPTGEDIVDSLTPPTSALPEGSTTPGGAGVAATMDGQASPSDAASGPIDGAGESAPQENAPAAHSGTARPQESGKADASTRGGPRAPPRRRKETQVGGTGVEEKF